MYNVDMCMHCMHAPPSSDRALMVYDDKRGGTRSEDPYNWALIGWAGGPETRLTYVE